jgi:hypothetical protein
MATFPLQALPLNWMEAESWLERFEFYLISNNINNTKAKAVFFANCGSAAYEFVKTALEPAKPMDKDVIFDSSDRTKLSITKLLETGLKPKVIIHYERYKLAISKQTGRSVQEFVADLKRLSNSCDFGVLRNEMLLTQFIIGMDNSTLRTRLLVRKNLSFDSAIQEALLSHESSVAAQHLDRTSSYDVNAFSGRHSSNKQTDSQFVKDIICLSCDGNHRRSNCRFREAICHNCSKQGHIARVCRIKNITHSMPI